MPLVRGFDAEIRGCFATTELIGVDEAGRGPLAGPVVAAAVLLGPGPYRGLGKVNDSKQLLEEEREALYPLILAKAQKVSVAWAQPRSIDKVNILQATLQAMRRAVLRLQSEAVVLVDGNCQIPRLAQRQMTVIDGDAKSFSIAAASVVAKVTRDRMMVRLDKQYPGYGLAQHKGYGTRAHRAAIREKGPSPIHRLTFAL